MGITHGTIAGLLLTDLILGRENPWAKIWAAWILQEGDTWCAIDNDNSRDLDQRV